MIPRWLISLFIALAFIGFVDATYLTVKHYQGGPLPCYILEGCDTVTTSKYSQIGPVPIAVLGIGFYLALVLLVINYWQTKNDRSLRLASRLTILGFLAAIVLLCLQAFVLQAYCLYCVISAIISIILFVLGGTILKMLQEL